jgi:hypothetical protein
MNKFSKNVKVKLILLKTVFVLLSLWLVISIVYSLMMGVYLSIILLLAFAIPFIDKVTVSKNEAIFERYYFYTFVKQSWRAGDTMKFRFNLYTGFERGHLPETDIEIVDLIIPLIPVRYKNQGIFVSKGATKWTSRSANFQLDDREYYMISELLKS